MNQSRMTSYLLAGAGVLFLAAIAINGFENKIFLALGFAFLGIGIALVPRARKT